MRLRGCVTGAPGGARAGRGAPGSGPLMGPRSVQAGAMGVYPSAMPNAAQRHRCGPRRGGKQDDRSEGDGMNDVPGLEDVAHAAAVGNAADLALDVAALERAQAGMHLQGVRDRIKAHVLDCTG